MTPDESLWQRLEADFARVLGEIPKPGTQRMFREVWSDPEFVAQVEAEKAETQAAIERHSREADK